MNPLEATLSRILKIPPRPEPPSGSGDSVRVFRAAKPFLFYLLFQWAIAQVGSFVGILFGLRFAAQIPKGFWTPWISFFEYAGIGLYLLQIPLTLAIVFLDFKLRWYMVSDRSLRIREGVYRVRERTMSYANIQNLSIRRGPLQQLLGISDVEVRSAGGGEATADDSSGKHDDLHRGLFRGVANGEAIRDLILGFQRRLRDSGLGDPDDHEGVLEIPSGPDEPLSLIAAARSLADEARALRGVLDRPNPRT